MVSIPRIRRAAPERRTLSDQVEWLCGRVEERDRLLRERLEHELSNPAPITDRVRRTALTAAVSRVEMDGASWKSWRFGDRAWQADAWRLYDITGQLRFVSNWAGACLSRCVLRIHEIDGQGNFGAVVDDPDITQLSSGPLGVGDSRAEALRLCGIILFVCGEAFLVAEAEGGVDGSDLWWVVTANQIKRQGDVITIPRPPIHGGGRLTYRDGVDLILRCWTPHPANTTEPDSSTRSAIPDLRKLEAIRKREFAELDSRLAGAGVMLIPDSVDLPRGKDDPQGTDGFAALLMRTMATSLRNRSSAEAMVPIIVQGNADDIDKVKHVTFWSPLSEHLSTMWNTTIVSLGQDLDIPPEVMAGLGNTNHWSAWAISEGAINEHVTPLASRVAAALTIGYLWPALEAMDLDDPTRYGYKFDPSLLTVRPNRSSDAITYHSAGLISDDTARTAGAWTEDTAPTPEEQARRIARELLLSSPQIALADPGIRQLLALPGLGTSSTVVAGETGETAPPERAEPPVEETGPPDTMPTNTTPRPDDTQSPPPPTTAVVPGGLDVALSLIARRAMTLAGQRLVPHRQRDRYGDIPAHRLPSRHGRVPADQVPTLLDRAWRDVEVVTDGYGLDPGAVTDLLHGICEGLLTRGVAYSDDIVTDALMVPGTLDLLRRTNA